ncbi:MAG: adenylate/guanylate cyclase domain-containing protein [Candidatus Eremiobacteraeota bacterium]|nr:adenylate/guanylate cyclase domain-containing protein [Candidatus Eremiobacteraeota bacterium]
MKTFRGPGIVVTAGIVLGLLLTWLGRPGGPLEIFELRALDGLFSARYRVFGPEPIDPRIVYVGIDEATFTAIGTPTLLWQPQYAQVLRTLTEGGAAAIGFDMIVHPELDKLAEDDPLRERLQSEELELGVTVSEGPVVMAELLTPDGKVSLGPSEVAATLAMRPDFFGAHENYKAVEGPNLGVVNVVQDRDQVTRRVPAFFYEKGVSGEVWGGGQVRTMGLRLLELGTGKRVTPRNGQLFLGEDPIPTDRGLSVRVNYPAPKVEGRDSFFDYVSMARLIDGSAGADRFRDKIVLIGPASLNLQDFHATPYDVQAYGPEVHLALMNTILTGRYIVHPLGLWLLVNALFGGLAGFIALRLPRKQAVLRLAGGFVVYAVVALWLFAKFGAWLPFSTAFFSLVLGFVAGYTERLLTVERERAQIRSTFARMVSTKVMEHVLGDEFELVGGCERRVTVLFSDINNFTPVCEQHSPREIIAMLSDYFELMVDVIMRYDGYIKQYVGDEIMVIFGAPDDQPDHAARAVRAGVEMLEVLRKAEREAQGRPGFYDIKIGVNTGPVVVGKVGPEQRWEYAAVGDDVNLGARVMSVTKALDTKMLVSKNTYDECKDQTTDLEWVSRGVQSFKGKTAQLEVFEVNKRG